MAGIFGPVLVNYIREYNITHGVPKAQAYNITMYIMAGLFVIGFFAIDLTCRLFRWSSSPLRTPHWRQKRLQRAQQKQV